MKKLLFLVCLVVFSCKEESQTKKPETKQSQFESLLISTNDAEILDEGFERGWEIVKDKQISILVNRDNIYYVFKNPTQDLLEKRFYLHLVIKDTQEFINLDFNFNEHLLELKNSNTIYKIAKRELPLKNILSITTRQVLDGKSLWEIYITDSNIY
jgi:hypothetical protein